MKRMTSYQEPVALGEGLAYGYMMKLRMLRSAAFDIKSFVTDSVLVQIRNNDPSAVLDPIKTVVIDQQPLKSNRRSVPFYRPANACWRTI